MSRRSKAELFEEIRREHEFGVGTIQGVSRKLGVHRRMVRQALGDAVPPARKSPERKKPRLEPVMGFINGVLEGDRKAPRKQWYTSHRIYERIRVEFPEHPVGESSVRRYVGQRKREMGFIRQETFVPQSYAWGHEAQIDGYEAVAELDGEPQKVQMFCMRSMGSGGAFHRAYPRATQQAFLEAYELGFRYFAGVFGLLRYDNLTSAVKKVLRGYRREETERFIAFRSHWKFQAEFCTPGEGHEKGGVEGEAGYFRRNHLVPVPKARDLADLPVTVRIPKVRAKTGEPVTFRSALVPPYVRKTRSLEAAVPWLYLKGVSSGEMGEALKVLVGPQAQGLSASTVSRLKQVWGEQYRLGCEERLDADRWVYVWADGIYSGLRAEQTKLCALVVIGVNERGEKRFLAIEDGVRESTQSWREVLLKLKSRGMNVPKLAIGDGAMGFWAALEEIYPETRQQRCWMHKVMNVLNCLPKSVQAKAKQALHSIWQAETKADAEKAFDLFIETYEPKYPKATLCLQKDREELLAFYDFPAKHWQSIRTTNPIESTFATIRHRTKRSRGCLTRDAMLHMMFKLGQCAENNWRRLRGFDDLSKVIIGVKFNDGVEATQVDQAAA